MSFLQEFKRIFCSLLTAGTITTLSANEKNNYEGKKDDLAPSESNTESKTNIERQIQELQDQVDALSKKMDHVQEKNGKYHAPRLPPGGFSANVEFLYWKANEDGLEYGTKMVAGPFIGQASKNKTRLLDLDFEWEPGFRLGVGYLFNHFDQWVLNLNWMHIHNHAHGKASAQGIESQVGNTNTIIPTWVNLLFELRSGASKAKAHWHLDFNTLDLDLGRSFFVSKKLVLNPHVGLRGAWIDQDYTVKYNSVFFLAEHLPPFTREVIFKADNDFAGFGIRGGSKLQWYFDKHWNLFADISGSVLYGSFNIKMKNLKDQGLEEGSMPPVPLDFTAKEHFWRTRLNFEEALGLGWETFYNRERFRISITAAYELSQWLSQNELFYTFYFRGEDTISSIPIRTQGNLGFQGVKTGIQLDF